jgi:hypothetical protein
MVIRVRHLHELRQSRSRSSPGPRAGGSLRERRLGTFFAPESLHLENAYQDAFKSRWCDLLEQGLLSSCHLLGVLSPAHLRSAYCDLEIQGFLRIVASNPSRGIVLVLSDLSDADVPGSLQPFVCNSEWSAIKSRLSGLVTSAGLRLGKVPYAPVTLFDPLPISGASDSWQFGFGPAKAKLRIFELYVREYMVLILKGLDPESVDLKWPMLATDDYKTEALSEARELIAAGVLPYPLAAQGRRLLTASEFARLQTIPKGETPAKLSYPPRPPSKRVAFQAKVKNDQSQLAKTYRAGLGTGSLPEGPEGDWYANYSVDYRHGHSVFCRRCGDIDEDEGPPPSSCPTCGWAGL